jgi:hypothetical protein
MHCLSITYDKLRKTIQRHYARLQALLVFRLRAIRPSVLEGFVEARPRPSKQRTERQVRKRRGLGRGEHGIEAVETRNS